MPSLTPPVDKTQRLTITLSAEVARRLRALVPARQRSKFIAEALDTELAMLEQATAMDAATGAWALENHPELATQQDIEDWLEELRTTWRYPRLESQEGTG